MKCREVRPALCAYLDGEVTSSERTLIDAHLSGCQECRREWAALSSRRGTLAGSLKSMGAQADPSPQAWIHLREAIAREPRPATNNTMLLLKGERPMKLRWRIALGAAGAVVLAAAVIAAVPSSRAAAGDLFAGVFHMHQYTPMDAGYLPAGFDVNPTAGSGMITVGSLSASDGQPEDVVEAEQALYENGDQFIYIETAKGRDKDVPDGQATKVNGEDAVIVTGLTGTLSMEPLLPEDARPDADAGMTVTTAGDGPAFVTGEAGLSVSGGENAQPSTQVVGGVQVEGGAEVVGGLPPAVTPVQYENATSLTWIVDGTWVQIISNLPLDEIIKVAEGLVPGRSE